MIRPRGLRWTWHSIKLLRAQLPVMETRGHCPWTCNSSSSSRHKPLPMWARSLPRNFDVPAASCSRGSCQPSSSPAASHSRDAAPRAISCRAQHLVASNGALAPARNVLVAIDPGVAPQCMHGICMECAFRGRGHAQSDHTIPSSPYLHQSISPFGRTITLPANPPSFRMHWKP